MSRQELADACNAVLNARYQSQGRSQRWAGLTEKAIGALERGEVRWPNDDYRKALCTVLQADERSLGLHIDRPAQTHEDKPFTAAGRDLENDARRRDLLPMAAAAVGVARLTELADALPGDLSSPVSALQQSVLPAGRAWGNGSPAAQHVQFVTLPSGRYFPGTDLEVRIFPAVSDGRVLAQLPPDYGKDPFVTRNRRGLVIGAVREPSGQTLYGLDTRHVRRKTSGCVPGRKLLIPNAYLLDEITVGLLWAIASFDEALLDDDRTLIEHVERLSHVANLERSANSLTTAADLSTPSAMWLGSEFCAQHILRNVDALAQTPTFWTREQRGEEASAWLLFAHKYAYLERLRQLFPRGMTRSFCVPEATVDASTASERVLLLLVAALMESFDIHCLVTNEPEYSDVDGFVLDAERRAIVANWIGTERVWYVDVTDARSAVREYADANGHVRSHSAIAAPTPVARLQALTAYLGLSWPLITRRCAELAAYGLSGIAEPRSRLLSLAGAERACRYLGDLAPAEGR